MAAFKAGSALSRGGLALYLTDRDGRPCDAASARWTVTDLGGQALAGFGAQAVRAAVGEYYAQWTCSVPNGAYRIAWDVTDSGGATVRVEEPFFVVDPASYTPAGPLRPEGVPPPGSFTFLNGQVLARGDLPLFLRDPDGFPKDASYVTWSVVAPGRVLTAPAPATRAGVGEYYAQWAVLAASGDYGVLWEWEPAPGEPLQSSMSGFSVIAPGAPVARAQ